MWFWSRPDVPDSITQANQSLNISSWGDPVAAYPTWQSCNTSAFFTAQQLIFDITLCGDWAGVPSIYDSTGCANAGPTGSCYLDNVAGPGSPKFDDAYFEVSYVRTYTTATAAPASTASSTLTSGPSTSQTAQTTQRTTSSAPHGAVMGGHAMLPFLVSVFIYALTF